MGGLPRPLLLALLIGSLLTTLGLLAILTSTLSIGAFGIYRITGYTGGLNDIDYSRAEVKSASTLSYCKFALYYRRSFN